MFSVFHPSYKLNLNILPIENFRKGKLFAFPLLSLGQATIDVPEIINKSDVQIDWKFIKKTIKKSIVSQPKNFFSKQPAVHINNKRVLISFAIFVNIAERKAARKALSAWVIFFRFIGYPVSAACRIII